MAEENTPATRLPRFLSIERLRREAKSAVVIGVIISAGYYFLWSAINPSHINHLVIIQDDPERFKYPYKLELINEGKVLWLVSPEMYGPSRSRSGDDSIELYVANISHAWLTGQLTLRDKDNNTMATVVCHSPGRYCGTCVIYIRRDGTTSIGWNRIVIGKHPINPDGDP